MKVLLVVSNLVFVSKNISFSYAGGKNVNTKQEIAEEYFEQMDIDNDWVIN
mgnify:CR=1 FL=1